MRVLVVRLSSIGDVVHALPVAAALHRAGHEVAWLVEPPARALLDENPAVARVIRAPAARSFSWSAARATRQALRMAGCDVALDLQGLWKSAAWARLSGAPRVAGWSRAWRREPASAVLLRETLDQPPRGPHVIDRNLALLRLLGLETEGLREFPLPPLARQEAAVEAGLRQLDLDDYVLLDPGGGWAGKLWAPERFGELARALGLRGFRSLVVWGPGEQALADRVVAASDGAALRSFPTSLLECAALARRARLVVAADTGPLHLACALGAPVLALFGPTDPARNGPFAADDVVVTCRPACFPCYRRSCATHAGVMDTLRVDDVLAASERRLAAAHRPVRSLAL
jgi:ADP-heptose:LPS heptosyltransferase